MLKAEDVQVGGSHYKTFAVQPYLLMLALSGPAAHIAGYLVRTKGEDDLQKAAHWCQLAIDAGLQGWQVELVCGVDEDTYYETPTVISAKEWCWANGIPRGSFLADALLSLEEGDFRRTKQLVELLLLEEEE